MPGSGRSPAGAQREGAERACPAGQRPAVVSMGGGASRPDSGAHDRLLAEFSGSAAIDISDPFWAQLLRFPAPLTQLPPADVEAATVSHCEELGAGRARRHPRSLTFDKLLHKAAQAPAGDLLECTRRHTDIHTLCSAAVGPDTPK